MFQLLLVITLLPATGYAVAGETEAFRLAAKECDRALRILRIGGPRPLDVEASRVRRHFSNAISTLPEVIRQRAPSSLAEYKDSFRDSAFTRFLRLPHNIDKLLRCDDPVLWDSQKSPVSQVILEANTELDRWLVARRKELANLEESPLRNRTKMAAQLVRSNDPQYLETRVDCLRDDLSNLTLYTKERQSGFIKNGLKFKKEQCFLTRDGGGELDQLSEQSEEADGTPLLAGPMWQW